jgi:hypothetical protein
LRSGKADGEGESAANTVTRELRFGDSIDTFEDLTFPAEWYAEKIRYELVFVVAADDAVGIDVASFLAEDGQAPSMRVVTAGTDDEVSGGGWNGEYYQRTFSEAGSYALVIEGPPGAAFEVELSCRSEDAACGIPCGPTEACSAGQLCTDGQCVSRVAADAACGPLDEQFRACVGPDFELLDREDQERAVTFCVPSGLGAREARTCCEMQDEIFCDFVN